MIVKDKNICIGLLAHVDSGKTTLSEAILYRTGVIRKAGRVDHGDAFLDTNTVERNRGITVFSKEARFSLGDKKFTLLDTPGHRDFSTEMERTLAVQDYAVLIISGTEGVQAHTMTLWKLLRHYDIPTVIFINKTDMAGANKDEVTEQLKASFGSGFAEFIGRTPTDPEEIALQDEGLMESYLETGELSGKDISRVLSERKIFPVLSGSALKMQGVDELLAFFMEYLSIPKGISYKDDKFAARVYKITRDGKGNRETHIRLLGGKLRSKDSIATAVVKTDDEDVRSEHSYLGQEASSSESNFMKEDEQVFEKIEQIRIYNGEKFEAVNEVHAGEVAVVTGLGETYAGQGLGELFGDDINAMLEPPLTYKLELPFGVDPMQAMQKLRAISDENPDMSILWDEELREIHVSVMGDLELEILKGEISKRTGMNVSFGQKSIIYKETVAEPVVGIGHFEPLRHYAEVRLILRPLPLGSGLRFTSEVSEDRLKKNWQRLIMTHLRERHHKGTLTRSDITDMEICITDGIAHLKHTMGGDFRQATYRAVRQGMRRALDTGKMRLLEPKYSFTLEIPQENLGRALSDMDRLGATFSLPEVKVKSDYGPVTKSLGTGSLSVITGFGPVSTLGDYQNEVNRYTGGLGRLSLVLEGYMPCHDQDGVVADRAYDPDTDKYHPCGSVFCEQGAGVYVEWDRVDDRAHTVAARQESEEKDIPRCGGDTSERPYSDIGNKGNVKSGTASGVGGYYKERCNEDKELSAIFEKTYGKSKRDEQYLRDRQTKAIRDGIKKGRGSEDNFPKPNPKGSRGKTHLVIDGYNLIFAWDELKDMAEANFDAAREILIEILQNYQGYKKTGITLVFDGYKLVGNSGTDYNAGDVRVVYTREGRTADRFIEEMVYEMGRDYDLTVVTSDMPVQMAAMGDGARRLSVREFREEVLLTSEEIREKLKRQKTDRNRPFKGKV